MNDEFRIHRKFEQNILTITMHAKILKSKWDQIYPEIFHLTLLVLIQHWAFYCVIAESDRKPRRQFTELSLTSAHLGVCVLLAFGAGRRPLSPGMPGCPPQGQATQVELKGTRFERNRFWLACVTRLGAPLIECLFAKSLLVWQAGDTCVWSL